jgi:yeast amino acid transporter
MDHEKPQAVGHLAHQVVHESFRESTVSPVSLDIEYADNRSLDEPVNIDERKDRRGESVWYASVQSGFLNILLIYT